MKHQKYVIMQLASVSKMYLSQLKANSLFEQIQVIESYKPES